jgi:hypothetical protein
MHHPGAGRTQVIFARGPIVQGLSKNFAQRHLNGGLFLEFLDVPNQQSALSGVQALLELGDQGGEVQSKCDRRRVVGD